VFLVFDSCGVDCISVVCFLSGIETLLTMDARLGYTYDVGLDHPNWTEVARSTEDRPLQCTATKVTATLGLFLSVWLVG